MYIETYREDSSLWDVTFNEYSNIHEHNDSYEILLNKLKEIKQAATIELLEKKINNMNL